MGGLTKMNENLDQKVKEIEVDKPVEKPVGKPISGLCVAALGILALSYGLNANPEIIPEAVVKADYAIAAVTLPLGIYLFARGLYRNRKVNDNSDSTE